LTEQRIGLRLGQFQPREEAQDRSDPILDLNRASEALGRTVAELREIASGLTVVFLGFCT
jgi:hypothetical protein